jgi:hypothetical protein
VGRHPAAFRSACLFSLDTADAAELNRHDESAHCRPQRSACNRYRRWGGLFGQQSQKSIRYRPRVFRANQGRKQGPRGHKHSSTAAEVEGLWDSINIYGALALQDFAGGKPIDLTALVELDSSGTRSTYFIGPRNGGLEIEFEGKEATVITPQSPLGGNLMGKKTGQRWTTKLDGSTIKYHIVSVQ